MPLYFQAPIVKEEKRLAHVERILIRWGDMDAMSHVNNTVYFRYMEQARISWFEQLVPEDEVWQSTGISMRTALRWSSSSTLRSKGRGVSRTSCGRGCSTPRPADDGAFQGRLPDIRRQ